MHLLFLFDVMCIFVRSNQIIFKALGVIMRDVPFLHAHGEQVRSHSETLGYRRWILPTSWKLNGIFVTRPDIDQVPILKRLPMSGTCDGQP